MPIDLTEPFQLALSGALLALALLMAISILAYYRNRTRIRASQAELTRTQNMLEALKDESRRYANVINMSRNPMWVRDKQMNITFCNLSFAEIAEGDDLDIAEIELYRGHREMAKRAWETETEQAETRHIVVGGKRRYYEIRELPSRVDGTVTGYARDITDLENAQSEIKRHLQAQRAILESSTSAMAVFGADKRLQSYNFAYSALWKLDEDFLDSNPRINEVLDNMREKRRLPEQVNFVSYKQQQLDLFTDLLEPQEEFIYLPDGKILRVVIIPHALGGLIFVYDDVTDRLALERSYNTLIAVQRETLDNLHEGIVVFGENGRMRLCNPVFLSLWKLDEHIADSDIHISEVLEESRSLFLTEKWDAFKQSFIGQMHSRENHSGTIERADGKVVDWAAVPLPDGGSLLTFIDVTDTALVERSLREKNEALEAADRLKTEFLANMSYELRSPLTTIAGFSDMLSSGYAGDLNETQQEYIDNISQSSRALSQLIDNVLDLASIEAGYLELKVKRIDVPEMVEAVVMLVQERAVAKNIKLIKVIDKGIGKMSADETRLKQVLFNLLLNAVRYAKSGGTVKIGVSESANSKLRFWVQDEGVGIEESQQAHVFEKFYRGGAASGQQSGTGLGLSIVKSFIELHGGYVELESTPGVGTKVTCTLPAEAEAA